MFLPLIGFVSDALGIQASMITLVPVALAAGFILRSANGFVVDDMIAVQAEALARVDSTHGGGRPGRLNERTAARFRSSTRPKSRNSRFFGVSGC